MAKTRLFVLIAFACGLGSFTVSVPGIRAQAASGAETKLPLNTVLVLTSDFCATTFKQGSIWTTGRETFAVGKMACSELAPAMKDAFASFTVVPAPPTSGDAQLVLIPKFANAHATTTEFAFSNREMDVFLEWTVKDASGKTVWLQTVQGSSKHHMGNMFTHGHDVKLIVQDSVKDVAARSVATMEAAPELRKLAASNSEDGK